MKRGALTGATPLWARWLVCAAWSVATGCGEPRPRAPEPAPAAAPMVSVSARATDEPVRPSAERPSNIELRKLVVAARKQLAADRAVIRNARGYELAAERAARDLERSGLARRFPLGEPERAALTKDLRAAVRRAGGRLEDLKIAMAAEAPAIPARHAGPGAYPYEASQLLATWSLKMTVAGVAADEAAGLKRALRSSLEPTIAIVSEDRTGGRAVIEARLRMRREVTPPVHELAPMTVESLAASAGVRPPPPGADLGELRALVDAHAALASDLGRAMRALGQAHLEAARLRACRAAAADPSADPDEEAP